MIPSYSRAFPFTVRDPGEASAIVGVLLALVALTGDCIADAKRING
jgi:hypothetical protein